MSEPPPYERAVALSCLLAVGALLALPLANPDIFWHLSAGRWIAQHAAVPRADWLSHTRAGAPWADFEWLSELAAYAALNAAGMRGLWVLKAAVLGGAGAALWSLLGSYATGPLGRALGVLAWFLVSPAANDLRPENFSLLLFFLLLGRLEAARRGVRAAASRGELAALAALFALWANLHAGFIYGLGLLALYAAAAAWRSRSALPLLPLAAAAAAPLANPYGAGVYAVPWQHWSTMEALQRHIYEWQEASVLSPWLWPFWALLVAAFAALAWRRWRRGEAPFEHAALLGALAWSASAHVRTTPYFAAAAVPVLADSMVAALSPRALRALAAASAVCCLGFFARQYRKDVLRPLCAFDPVYVPARGARFLEGERAAFAGKRLYNPWHWGGYLGWRLDGEAPVFVDGRYLFHELLEPMHAANQSPEVYAALLDKYRVEAAVVQRTEQLNVVPAALKDGRTLRLPRPFYVFFLPRERWALVHWDDRALVFVRRAAFDAAWVKEREYRWFRPDDLPAAALAVKEGEASIAELTAEVGRWVKTAEKPEANGAWLWLAGATGDS